MTVFTAMILSAVPACDSVAVRGEVDGDCGAALRRFEDASETNLPLVRQYGFCVSGNRGTEACETAFRRLHEAHRAFERAVAERRAECGVDLPAGGTR